MNKMAFRFILLLVLFFVQVNEIMAGPGGKIASSLFESIGGRILMSILGIILLPIIIYVFTKEFFAIRKTQKNLKQLSVSFKEFDELSLKNRVTDVFTRVHKGWTNASVEECAEYMSDWYWQNQQMVFLDHWKKNNLENVSNLKRINSISPLHLRVCDAPGYEGSRIIYKIDANIEDYLRRINSKSIVEGKEGYKDVETIWTFILDQGKWKVDNIEQSDMALYYAKMEDIVPVGISPKTA